MKATIAVGLKDAGMDVTFEFDLSDATDIGRFKALGMLLAKHGAAASTREKFFPLVIDNLDAIVSGTRVTMAGDAKYSAKPIIAPSSPRAGFKNALDVAIEKANARGTPVPKQTTVTQRPATSGNRVWPALDLSETMDSQEPSGVVKKRDSKKL